MTAEFPIEMTVWRCAQILGFDRRKARNWLRGRGVEIRKARIGNRECYTVRTADLLRAFPDAAERIRDRMLERIDDFGDV